MVSPAQLYSGKSSLALVRLHARYPVVPLAVCSSADTHAPLGWAGVPHHGCRRGRGLWFDQVHLPAHVQGAFQVDRDTGAWSHPQRRQKASARAPTNPMPWPSLPAAALGSMCVWALR